VMRRNDILVRLLPPLFFFDSQRSVSDASALFDEAEVS